MLKMLYERKRLLKKILICMLIFPFSKDPESNFLLLMQLCNLFVLPYATGRASIKRAFAFPEVRVFHGILEDRK